MNDQGDGIIRLRCQIASLEQELESLKVQLVSAESKFNLASATSDLIAEAPTASISPSRNQNESPWKWPLKEDQYRRYGRQMIVPQVGLQGQLSLHTARVLVIGLGGLGCPAAAYLAGAGVGTLGLVDGDTVELSNLHRQILHTTDRIGCFKVESAYDSLRCLNPLVQFIRYPQHLTPGTALGWFEGYDLILDCTDNPASRYLISDAAVLSGKPLVSASALRTEGQLMVLNHPPRSSDSSISGPCYRCVFPRPPPPETVTSCGEGGILGPVVGVMGVLMALEAIKIIFSADTTLEERASMLLFSAFGAPAFRSIRLRGRRLDCFACGDPATLTKDSLKSGALDYTAFCGTSNSVNLLEQNERITAIALQKIRTQLSKRNHVLLDVRDEVHFGLCHLPNSINIPISTFERSKHSRASDLNLDLKSNSHLNLEPNSHLDSKLDSTLKAALRGLGDPTSIAPIYTICRRGQDSQAVVRELLALGYGNGGARWIGDVVGGLQAWKEEVDPTWPEY